jgi:micrococcal nuclease
VCYLAVAGLSIAAAGCGGQGPSDEPNGLEEADSGVVATITDGDTLRLADGRRIRLVQIDAPEEATECYGTEATRALIALAPRGTEVELVRDPALDDADGGGRLLRYVEADGENLNLRLVADGAAVPYFFRGERGRYAEELLDAADEARRDRRGFWRACPGAVLNPGLGSPTGG